MAEFASPFSLGAAIKARRRQLGWSQEELAQRVAACGDVTFRQSDVSRLECGKIALPHRDRLAHIATVLGLSIGELLARSGWAGADAAFTTPSFGAAIVSGDHEPARAANVAPAGPLAGAALREERRRSVELIAQAQAAWERSQEILQQCEITRAKAKRVIGMGQHQSGDTSAAERE